jgi:hypothetical protein
VRWKACINQGCRKHTSKKGQKKNRSNFHLFHAPLKGKYIEFSGTKMVNQKIKDQDVPLTYLISYAYDLYHFCPTGN